MAAHGLDVVMAPRRRRCRYCEPDPPGCCSVDHARGCRVLCTDCARRARVATTYGMTLRNYMHLYHDLCGGVCGVCGRTHSGRAGGVTVYLSVDHIHAKGASVNQAAEKGLIRGILCTPCNQAVAFADLLLNEAYWLTVFTADHYRKVRVFSCFTFPRIYLLSPHLCMWKQKPGTFWAPPKLGSYDLSTANWPPTIVRI